MTYEEAIKKITSEWEELYKKQSERNDYYFNYPKTPAVFVAKSDTSEPYEVNLEMIGISPQGNVVWAYASGCSCWDGNFTEKTKPTIKEFTLNHTHTPEDWIAKIIKFAETGEVQDF